MKHEIDLSKYPVRTDLAIEALPKEGFKKEEASFTGGKVTRIFLDKKIAAQIDKQKGNYTTIEFNDVTDSSNFKKIEEVFTFELKNMLERMQIKEDMKALVVGLGNLRSTPDSLGPLTIDNVLVTNHLALLDSLDAGYRAVMAIKPGVTGETGIETEEIILSLVHQIKPDFLIVIDALASQSIERVNKTIQMADSGISPGSGIGNHRKELSFKTLHIPVLALGVPTVVLASTIVFDTIKYMQQHFAYMRKNLKKPLNKLVFTNQINYLKEKVVPKKEEKEELLGLVGSLTDEEVKSLILEVLTPIGYNLMVTPKEIDFVIEKLSLILASGINQALHPIFNKEN